MYSVTLKQWVFYFMQGGYKEREDRIAELEEFINNQVTELDKMEAEITQVTAEKQLLEEDYQVQKVGICFKYTYIDCILYSYSIMHGWIKGKSKI